MYYGIVYLYLLFWMVLSENLTIEAFFIGIVISLLVTTLNKDIISDFKKINLRKNIISWVSYTLMLIKEILISNFNVAKIVLSPRMEISPTIVKIKTKIKSDFHKTIFANSITLTPGTLTISMNKDEIAVHCLKDEYAIGIMNSEFERLILKVEEDIYE